MEIPILIYTKFKSLGHSELPNSYYYNSKAFFSSDSRGIIINLSERYLNSFSEDTNFFISFINPSPLIETDLEIDMKEGEERSNLIQKNKDEELMYTILMITGGGLIIWVFLLFMKTICSQPDQNLESSRRNEESENEALENEFRELLDKAMPLQTFSEIVSNKLSKSSSCAVCLLDFEEEDQARLALCSHIFHLECIDEWLKRHKNCPFCRASMEIEDLKKFIAEQERNRLQTEQVLVSQVDEALGLIDSKGNRHSARIEIKSSNNAGLSYMPDYSNSPREEINNEEIQLSLRSLPENNVIKNQNKNMKMKENEIVTKSITHREYKNIELISLKNINVPIIPKSKLELKLSERPVIYKSHQNSPSEKLFPNNYFSVQPRKEENKTKLNISFNSRQKDNKISFLQENKVQGEEVEGDEQEEKNKEIQKSVFSKINLRSKTDRKANPELKINFASTNPYKDNYLILEDENKIAKDTNIPKKRNNKIKSVEELISESENFEYSFCSLK